MLHPEATDIVERLRTEQQRGVEDIEPWQVNPYLFSEAADEIERVRIELKAAQTGIGALQETVERLRTALDEILRWSEAYPADIFHEPSKDECHRANELLTANGMTLDAFSASMGRHCTKGVGEIARRALEEKENE